MKRAVYSSSWIPPELIAAGGWEPVRAQPDPSAAPEPPAGVCPWAWAVEHAAARAEADAWLGADTCDQARRTMEIAPSGGPPRIVLHIPAAVRSPNALPWLAGEYRRLAAVLARAAEAGDPAAALPAAHAAMQARRRALRAAVERAPAAAAARAYSRFPEETARPVFQPLETGRPAVMALGGPLTPADSEWLDALERDGLRVAAHGCDRGPRTWPEREADFGACADPFVALAAAWLEIPDVFQRPADGLKAWIETAIRREDIRGLVLVSHRWCDLWRGEFARLRAAGGLPIVELEAGAEAGFGGSRATRLEAFAESVRRRAGREAP